MHHFYVLDRPTADMAQERRLENGKDFYVGGIVCCCNDTRS